MPGWRFRDNGQEGKRPHPYTGDDQQVRVNMGLFFTEDANQKNDYLSVLNEQLKALQERVSIQRHNDG